MCLLHNVGAATRPSLGPGQGIHLANGGHLFLPFPPLPSPPLLLYGRVRTGGVVPTVAGDLHEEHLGEVARDALQQSQLKLEVGGAEAAEIGGGWG